MSEGSGFSFAGKGAVSRAGSPVGLGGAATPRSAVLLALLAWVPLLVLSLVTRRVGGETLATPFAEDLAAHARLLLAVPLFLLADKAVGQRLAAVIEHFRHAGLLPEESRTPFERAVDRLLERRDSTVAEVVVTIAAFGAAALIMPRRATAAGNSWMNDAAHLTAAGWWYAIVGLPLFLFLLGRWLWRGALWAAFLRSVSRMRLSLSAGHPDRAGGLGFLCWGQGAFAPIVLALSIVFAAGVGERVVYRAEAIGQFKNAAIGFVVLTLIVVYVPLFFFGKPIRRLRKEALLAYSALAVRHQSAFDGKWLGAKEETILGSPDASSMADLAADFGLVDSLRGAPLVLKEMKPVIFAAILPFLPVVAAVLPLKEVLGKLLKIVA